MLEKLASSPREERVSLFDCRIGRIVSHRIVDVLCISGTISDPQRENVYSIKIQIFLLIYSMLFVDRV